MFTAAVLAPTLPGGWPLAAPPAGAVGGPSGGSAPSPGPGYRPPLDRPVVDPFREAAGPYGPGNRGLEYATVPGDPVAAIGPGVVAFAGAVAGRSVVAVVHPDGLRSTYTGLVTRSVTVGDVVAAGTPLGAAAARFHLGVRRGRRYLDPAALFVGRLPPRHAVLVPRRSAAADRPRWGRPWSGRVEGDYTLPSARTRADRALGPTDHIRPAAPFGRHLGGVAAGSRRTGRKGASPWRPSSP